MPQWQGRDHIPIGAYRGPIGRPADTPGPDWVNHGAGWYAKALVDNFPSPIQDSSQVADALTIFRRALADAPRPNSITVLSVGHANNLLDLLRSPPDAISPLRVRGPVAPRRPRNAIHRHQHPFRTSM
eukprot:4273416-Prymnesium_polylepis.1